MPFDDNRGLPEVRAVLDSLLRNLDATAPDLIAGVHLIGSIALGDAHPGHQTSDIDLVLVRDNGTDNAEMMAALEPALRRVREAYPSPVLDGIVLNRADLAAGPDRIDGERPVIFDSVARLGADGSARNPVTWRTLAQCGITYRGLPIDQDTLWNDPARLESWIRENFADYWRPWLDRAATADVENLSALELESGVEWGVLGVVRLHYSLATEAILSKGGAVAYALATFNEQWHPIIIEAQRIRNRDSSPTRYTDGRIRHAAMCAFVDMVTAHACATGHKVRRYQTAAI